jgi:hypothetical protein
MQNGGAGHGAAPSQAPPALTLADIQVGKQRVPSGVHNSFMAILPYKLQGRCRTRVQTASNPSAACLGDLIVSQRPGRLARAVRFRSHDTMSRTL